ncbi:MAG: General transcription factor IIH subunit 3, partial [Paramarteilia canceri]
MINYSQGLTVDSLSYKNVSLMLQQAAEITGGIAISVDNFQDFTEALQRFVFIDDFKDCFDRPKFEQNVDHRALCFCHQKIVNTGFACS